MEQLYSLYLLLFLVGGGAAIYLVIRNLRAENAALTRRAVDAEAQLQDIERVLTQPERDKLNRERAARERELNRRRPMPNPPGFTPTLQRLRQSERDPYAFAVGWDVLRGTPDVVSLTLTDDSDYRAGNIAVTGESGHGKGTLEQGILLQLAHNTTTSQLQFQIIDPKSSDAALWRGKAYMWRDPVVGEDYTAIKTTMDALRAERQKRDKLRTEQNVREWGELPPELRPPRLLVWITELGTVAKAIEKFDDWLDDELAKCRASGITYMIDLQNQSGKEMSWRTHIGTFIAGFQASAHHIRPNIGMGADEIVELGGVLPTELARGQFTVRNKRDVGTVAAPHLTTADIRAALALLPGTSVVSPLRAGSQQAGQTNIAPLRPVADDLPITSELWAQIVTAAREVETRRNPSRADVYRIVFAAGDPKASPTGDNYKRVKRVCDAEGLLTPRMAGVVSVEMVDTS